MIKIILYQRKKKQDNTLKTKAIISEKISFDNKKYENYLNYSKNNRFHIINKDQKLMEVSEFPILVGDFIKLNYYNYIFNYLYIDKYNIKNSPKYPPYITQIKDLNEKDKKKNI